MQSGLVSLLNFSRGSLFEECFFAYFFSKKSKACPARARKIGKRSPIIIKREQK
jgi:hypothetical protein